MSGSTSGVFLCRSLLARDIPVVALVVGDSSNQLYCKNTINTLAGLDKFARENNKALSIIYINNHSLVRDGVGLNTAEKEANEKLTNILTSLSLFWCNGNKKDIDDQDMINIILPSNYKSISIKPGLYGIMFFSKEIKAVEGSLPVLGRSLSKLGGDCAIEINLLHHKSGFITAEHILEVVKEENLPLHMISFGNFFIAENKKLQELYAHYENAANAISNEQLVGCNDSSVDETGLIL